MFSAVHSDRSGRLVVAADYSAAMSDGSAIGPLAHAVRLPAGTDVVQLPGRTGIGLDRSGRVRELGSGRFGVGAILPIGYLRMALPAYEDDLSAPPLRPRAYAASRHLVGEGTVVAFGRACEGEPLLAVRLVEAAIVGIRERTRLGTIHLETNGSVPVALRRLCDAGLDSVAVRIASARAETFEAIHRPEGFRFKDVRASIATAIAAKISVALRVLSLPGLTDRPIELDALLGLAGELPEGSSLILSDLSADPQRALRIVGAADAVVGMEQTLDRLRTDAAHLRIVALPRPLVRR